MTATDRIRLFLAHRDKLASTGNVSDEVYRIVAMPGDPGILFASDLRELLSRVDVAANGEPHPMRCPETLGGLHETPVGYHRHMCNRPARIPAGVVGLVEHHCDCGMSWTDLNPVGGAS